MVCSRRITSSFRMKFCALFLFLPLSDLVIVFIRGDNKKACGKTALLSLLARAIIEFRSRISSIHLVFLATVQCTPNSLDLLVLLEQPVVIPLDIVWHFEWYAVWKDRFRDFCWNRYTTSVGQYGINLCNIWDILILYLYVLEKIYKCFLQICKFT